MNNRPILYIGSLASWCNSFRRYKALKTINEDTDAIDTDPYILPKWIAGFQHHLNTGPGIFMLNRKIRKKVSEKKYEVILVDNKSYLSKKTLQYIRKLPGRPAIVNLLTDDPFGKFTRSWRLIKRTAAYYDIFFVQRKANIKELKKIGAAHVEICYRSFDPSYNRPVELDGDDIKRFKTTVGFAGTYEINRAEFIAYLIQQGVEVKVTGNDWPEKPYWEIVKPHYQGPSVYGEDYIKTLNGMDIALHFLRHGNRDEQDSRTFEIPACKVFMLAESSELHKELFTENEEAVFFDTKEELLKKVHYFIRHEKERTQIAAAGYNRCYSSGYDHRSRMEDVLQSVEELKVK